MTAPLAVGIELNQWIEAYRRLLQHYLSGHRHVRRVGKPPHDYIDELPHELNMMPLSNDFASESGLLTPSSGEIHDPRPILTHSDGTFNGLGRRRVYHAVNFEVSPHTADFPLLKSSFAALTDQLQSYLVNWYKNLHLPIRSTATARQFRQRVEQVKRRLGL